MALIDHMDGDRMVFRRPLIQARILRRPNRFIAEVDLGDGRVTIAHCPSTGSIGGIKLDGFPCLLSGPHDLAHRRTEYTVEAIAVVEPGEEGFQWIGVNQSEVNRFVRTAYMERQLEMIPAVARTSLIHSEPRVGSGRLDFLLDDDVYVEVKMPLQILQLDIPDREVRIPGHHGALRMVRQIEDLMEAIPAGAEALMIMAFIYDCPPFRPLAGQSAESSTIADTMERAHRWGLQRWQVNFQLTPEWVRVDRVERLI